MQPQVLIRTASSGGFPALLDKTTAGASRRFLSGRAQGRYMPPHKAFSAATAAMPAVSVRSTRGPIDSAMAPRGDRRVLFLLGIAAFRADQQRHRLRRLVARPVRPATGWRAASAGCACACRAGRSSAESCRSGASRASRLRPLCSEAATITPCQWACALFGALGRQPHHAALGRQRLDRRHPQLDRFFDDPVHLRRFRQRLRQRDCVRQLAVALDEAPGCARWRASCPRSPVRPGTRRRRR